MRRLMMGLVLMGLAQITWADDELDFRLVYVGSEYGITVAFNTIGHDAGSNKHAVATYLKLQQGMPTGEATSSYMVANCRQGILQATDKMKHYIGGGMRTGVEPTYSPAVVAKNNPADWAIYQAICHGKYIE